MTVTDNTDAEQMRTMKAAMLLEQVKAMGLELDDLVAYKKGGQLPGQITFHDYLPTVRKAAPAGSVGVWNSYWDLLDTGAPNLCACLCDTCLAAPVERGGFQEPCPCLATGSCTCPKRAFGLHVTTCLETYGGIGHKVLAAVVGTDIEEAQRWAKLRAEKRWKRRNRKRADKGRAQFKHTGKSAQEHTRAAASAVFRRAEADPSTGVTRNIALDAPKTHRPKSTARAYTNTQLAELWDTIFTCGLADPELAMLVFWFHLETGARRGGALRITVGDLDLFGQMVQLQEKFDNVALQPMSIQLQRSLIGHALERGDIVLATTGGLGPADVTVDDVVAGRVTLHTDAPVLYYQKRRTVTAADGTTTTVPHPLTRRFYNTLWDRLCAALPWADQIHARPHDLRKTGAQWVERALGYSVAKAWLRHKVDDHTLTYTQATPEQVARAFEALTGRSHPLTQQPGDHDRR